MCVVSCVACQPFFFTPPNQGYNIYTLLSMMGTGAVLRVAAFYI